MERRRMLFLRVTTRFLLREPIANRALQALDRRAGIQQVAVHAQRRRPSLLATTRGED